MSTSKIARHSRDVYSCTFQNGVRRFFGCYRITSNECSATFQSDSHSKCAVVLSNSIFLRERVAASTAYNVFLQRSYMLQQRTLTHKFLINLVVSCEKALCFTKKDEEKGNQALRLTWTRYLERIAVSSSSKYGAMVKPTQFSAKEAKKSTKYEPNFMSYDRGLVVREDWSASSLRLRWSNREKSKFPYLLCPLEVAKALFWPFCMLFLRVVWFRLVVSVVVFINQHKAYQDSRQFYKKTSRH